MEKVSATQFVRIWAVLGLLALILIWFLPWRFQTNDDELMMWLVSGAYTGEPESYAVFIHPILSWIFAKLYTVFPEIPWYPLTWFGLIYGSYLALILSLRKGIVDLNYRNILALFSLLLFLHFGLFPQFTIVSGIATFSGLLLLSKINTMKSANLVFLALALITASILIRWESTLLILIVFIFFRLNFMPLSDILSLVKLVVAPSLLLLVLVGVKIGWEKQSEYADFVSYNRARAAVSDHPVSYNFIKNEKYEIGSPWFFFSQWMMEDDGIDVQELHNKKEELDAENNSYNQISNSLERLITVMKEEAFKSSFSLLLIFYYFYSFKFSSKSLIFLSFWACFFLVFNHFFILNGRVVILFVLPILFPLILVPTQRKVEKIPFITIVAFLLLLFGYHLANFSALSKARLIMQNEYKSLIERVPEQAVIVLEGYKENHLGIDYTLKNSVPLLSLGWISKSPFQQKKLKHSGLAQLSDASEFYLIGVDVNNQYFFPMYMNYLGGNFQLENKIELENFILFHYIKPY